MKPVSTDFRKLGIKKTSSFDRAYKELCHHRELVEASLKGRSSLLKLQNEKPVESPKKENCSVEDSLSSSKTPVSRKRKSTPTVPVKPTSVKRPASVPVKKNKKFYQESPTSSSPKNTSQVTQEIFFSCFF